MTGTVSSASVWDFRLGALNSKERGARDETVGGKSGRGLWRVSTMVRVGLDVIGKKLK